MEANINSDKYVLLTLSFASVLFFSGIGTTFTSRRVGVAMFSMALLLLLATMISLGTMPICKK